MANLATFNPISELFEYLIAIPVPELKSLAGWNQVSVTPTLACAARKDKMSIGHKMQVTPDRAQRERDFY